MPETDNENNDEEVGHPILPLESVDDKELFYEAITSGLIDVGLEAYCHVQPHTNFSYKSYMLVVDNGPRRYQITISFSTGMVSVRRVAKLSNYSKQYALGDPKLFEKIKEAINADRYTGNCQPTS